jgi:hypothetical protein
VSPQSLEVQKLVKYGAVCDGLAIWCLDHGRLFVRNDPEDLTNVRVGISRCHNGNFDLNACQGLERTYEIPYVITKSIKKVGIHGIIRGIPWTNGLL